MNGSGKEMIFARNINPCLVFVSSGAAMSHNKSLVIDKHSLFYVSRNLLMYNLLFE